MTPDHAAIIAAALSAFSAICVAYLTYRSRAKKTFAAEQSTLHEAEADFREDLMSTIERERSKNEELRTKIDDLHEELTQLKHGPCQRADCPKQLTITFPE